MTVRHAGGPSGAPHGSPATHPSHWRFIGAPIQHAPAQAAEGEGTVKKFWDIFKWFLLAYFVYAVVKSPDAAANIVKTLFQIIGDAFRGIVGVFDAILGRT